jgi:hypothetical protein
VVSRRVDDWDRLRRRVRWFGAGGLVALILWIAAPMAIALDYDSSRAAVRRVPGWEGPYTVVYEWVHGEKARVRGRP